MVEQIIKYSDGTETSIKYRGVIENGVLTEDNPMEEEKEFESEVSASEDVAELGEVSGTELEAESIEESA